MKSKVSELKAFLESIRELDTKTVDGISRAVKVIFESEDEYDEFDEFEGMSDDDIIASEIEVDEDEIADMEDEVNEEVSSDEGGKTPASEHDAKRIGKMKEAFASVNLEREADKFIANGKVDVRRLAREYVGVYMLYIDLVMYGTLKKARMANRPS